MPARAARRLRSRFTGCQHSLSTEHERFIGCGALVCSVRYTRCLVYDMLPPRAESAAPPLSVTKRSWFGGKPSASKRPGASVACSSVSALASAALGSAQAQAEVARMTCGVRLGLITAAEELCEMMCAPDLTEKLDLRRKRRRAARLAALAPSPPLLF
eukprot:3421368-Pleurochrysis_carterae.AAC.1